ncbi:hypothetical protein [Candidatus Hecatella orcuttiae]|uniref:hypothetical protein n=1 Tax=Candidatus Hecatella orcuttiae TaxID=1935119 RepID=UPI0028680AEE|nr:hypothetical protein [Candidatus Hecatella orcuttiae]
MALNLEECLKSPLWPLLVETAHAIPTYPYHKSYVRDVLLRDNPTVDASEVHLRLGIPLGEALVILNELKTQKSNKSEDGGG